MNIIKYADIAKTGPNLTNIRAVIESIDNIISTRIGERPFNREFGSRIEDYLFEPLSFSNSRLILSELFYSISRWEPRVSLHPDTEVDVDYEGRKYKLNMKIIVVGMEVPIEYEKELNQKQLNRRS